MKGCSGMGMGRSAKTKADETEQSAAYALQKGRARRCATKGAFH